ncbi:hypothetical protein DFH08DRAFT_341518 [Mycena albidolilacea]|uniref:Uncharacterized protein n=1 Tax=Mycena albidolilacea TaxID=1033008 RepID=A0AAD7EHH3_9AGAR|nr:hypothetical protein DFH08DRAFT_341518 [Mycena albidolilacea]
MRSLLQDPSLTLHNASVASLSLKSKDETNKVECNRHDCETKWYRLLCVDMEFAITHWTCEACASSASGSRPTRRVRRG